MEQTNITNDINRTIETPSINPIIPKPNNIYKYLFFLTLVILFGIIFYFYNVINKRTFRSLDNNISKIIPTSSPSNFPTVITNNTKTRPTQIIEAKKEIIKTPTGWVEYINKELGFAFFYPKEYGSIKVSSTYGDEGTYGKLYTFSFDDKNCPISSCGKSIEMLAAAPNFSGIGTNRLIAMPAGYYINKDGSVTDRLFGTKFKECVNANYKCKEEYYENWSKYDSMTIDNTTNNMNIITVPYDSEYFFHGEHTKGLITITMSAKEINGDWIEQQTTITFNLNNNPSNITGFQFTISDNPEETTNAELLKSVAKTFRLLN